MKTDEAFEILRRIQEPEAWEPQISEKAFDALEMAIDALALTRWIPCSERLPERKCGEYLCTSKWLEEDAEEVKVLAWGRVSKTANDCKKRPEMIAGRTFDGWGFGEDWYGKIDNVEKVSAWMPLPKPYI